MRALGKLCCQQYILLHPGNGHASVATLLILIIMIIINMINSISKQGIITLRSVYPYQTS